MYYFKGGKNPTRCFLETQIIIFQGSFSVRYSELSTSNFSLHHQWVLRIRLMRIKNIIYRKSTVYVAHSRQVISEQSLMGQLEADVMLLSNNTAENCGSMR